MPLALTTMSSLVAPPSPEPQRPSRRVSGASAAALPASSHVWPLHVSACPRHAQCRHAQSDEQNVAAVHPPQQKKL